jgi:hypothetical protein
VFRAPAGEGGRAELRQPSLPPALLRSGSGMVGVDLVGRARPSLAKVRE